MVYICLSGNFKHPFSGVEKKIVSKLACLSQQTERLTVVFPYKNNFKETTNINCDVVYLFESKPKRYRYLDITFQNYKLYNRMNEVVSPLIKEGSCVLFRFPMSSIGLLKFVKMNPNAVVFEHNTKELEEALLNVNKLKSKISFSLRPSIFFNYIEQIILPVFIERRITKKVLQYAKAGVCVTHELAEYEKKRFSGYKTVVISNGIDVNLFSPISYKPIEKTINIIMLNGFEAEWRGLDRYIVGIKKYKGTYDFQFHVYGKNLSEEIASTKQNGLDSKIHFHDVTSKEELDKVMESFHFGLSDLASFRKDMLEGCSLKIREYLSRGLPVILAQRDTDLSFNKKCGRLLY
ncbi:MAG: hypothetical protein IPG89_18550 [Bacteroidetes bacterium]|nr:hypothetical protein [Bacteroidota bacterium]